MDAFSHINNVMYFKYFETARIAHFYRLGKSIAEKERSTPISDRFDWRGFMEASGVGPILASTSCKFKAPGKYPDDLIVGSRAEITGDDRFLMHYRVFSTTSRRSIADGDGMIVMYDYSKNCKTSIPAPLRTALHDVDQEVPSFS